MRLGPEPVSMFPRVMRHTRDGSLPPSNPRRESNAFDLSNSAAGYSRPPFMPGRRVPAYIPSPVKAGFGPSFRSHSADRGAQENEFGARYPSPNPVADRSFRRGLSPTEADPDYGRGEGGYAHSSPYFGGHFRDFADAAAQSSQSPPTFVPRPAAAPAPPMSGQNYEPGYGPAYQTMDYPHSYYPFKRQPPTQIPNSAFQEAPGGLAASRGRRGPLYRTAMYELGGVEDTIGCTDSIAD